MSAAITNTRPQVALQRGAQRPMSLSPQNVEEAWRLAEMFSRAGNIPDAYKGKPGDIMVAWQFGSEVGLGMAASLRWIYVHKGIASIFGNGAKAVVSAHPDCTGIRTWWEMRGDQMVGCATIERRGRAPVTKEFTQADALRAKCWMKKTDKGYDTPWVTHPGDMLAYKALHRASSDQFPDALCGLSIYEDVADYDDTPREARNVTPMPDAGTGRTKLTIRASHPTTEGDHSPNVVADPDPTPPIEDESQEVTLAAAVAHVAELRDARNAELRDVLLAKLTTINGEDLKSVGKQLRALGLLNNAAIKACDDPDLLLRGLAILANALGEPTDADLDAAEVQ